VTGPTFNLTLDAAQASHLLRLVDIADLGMGEHYRNGWLPTGRGDAELMQKYVKEMETAPSLERPLKQLREWRDKTEKGKP
jgi:hypothetical protein